MYCIPTKDIVVFITYILFTSSMKYVNRSNNNVFYDHYKYESKRLMIFRNSKYL